MYYNKVILCRNVRCDLFYLKRGDNMSRETLDPIAKDRTTIMLDKKLSERVNSHIHKNSESLVSFLSRAIVNQLEREGDFTIRAEMEEQIND